MRRTAPSGILPTSEEGIREIEGVGTDLDDALGVAILSLAALGAAGATVVQRLVPIEMRKTNNAAVGIIFGGLYVLFGTMIGFTAFPGVG